jgi:hypothetical protein
MTTSLKTPFNTLREAEETTFGFLSKEGGDTFFEQ